MAAQHPKKERSFVIVKPDGVQRGLMGDRVKGGKVMGETGCVTNLPMPPTCIAMIFNGWRN